MASRDECCLQQPDFNAVAATTGTGINSNQQQQQEHPQGQQQHQVHQGVDISMKDTTCNQLQQQQQLLQPQQQDPSEHEQHQAADNNTCSHPKRQQQHQGGSKRPMCSSCGRPLRVCYCAALPPEPVVLGGAVVILQHPLEVKRTLATVPLLCRVLSPQSLTVLVHRRLLLGKWQQLDTLMAAVQQQQVPLLVLFPGKDARDITEVAQELREHPKAKAAAAAATDGGSSELHTKHVCLTQQQRQDPLLQNALPRQQQQQEGSEQQQFQQQLQQQVQKEDQNQQDPQPKLASNHQQNHKDQQQQQPQQPQSQQVQQQQQQAGGPLQQLPRYMMLVVDGTWHHAREMFDALQPWLLGPGGLGLQVQLPHPEQGEHQQGQQQQQQQQQSQSADGPVPESTATEQTAAAAGAAAPSAAAAAALPPPTLLFQRDSSSKLRTEPAEGTCSTLEAVAAAVAVLEGDGGLYHVCMAPLRMLTQHQAAFDPAVAARTQPGGSGVVRSKKRLGMRNRLGKD